MGACAFTDVCVQVRVCVHCASACAVRAQVNDRRLGSDRCLVGDSFHRMERELEARECEL